MTDEDLERIAHRPGKGAMSCGTCGKLPTCSVLTDDLWRELWRLAGHRGFVELPCECVEYQTTLHGSTPVRAEHYDDPHCPRNRRRRELLCLECAESLMGRRLTLEDLQPCVANYATYVMVGRR